MKKEKIYLMRAQLGWEECDLQGWYSNFRGEAHAIISFQDGTLGSAALKNLRMEVPKGGKIVTKNDLKEAPKVEQPSQPATIRGSLNGQNPAPKAKVTPGSTKKPSEPEVKGPVDEESGIELPNVTAQTHTVDENEPK